MPPIQQRTIVWTDLIGAVLLGVLATIGIAGLVIPTLIVAVTSFDTQEFIGFPPRGFAIEHISDEVANHASVRFLEPTRRERG